MSRHPYADHRLLRALEALALEQVRLEMCRYLMAIRGVDAAERGEILQPERVGYPAPGQLKWPHLVATERQMRAVLGLTHVSSLAP